MSFEKSALSSLMTVSVEILTFAACAAVLTAPALTAARFLVGASGSAGNYVLNRRWAFGDRAAPKRTQGLRFALVSVTAVSLGTVLYWAAARAGADPRVAHVGSMATVWLMFTFPLMKRWVFAPRAGGAAGVG